MQEKSQNADEKPLSIYKTKEAKGKRAEELFLTHLNNLNIPFLYIDQNKELFSKKLLDNYITRPDYIVYTLNGDFYIDVKYREKLSFTSKDDNRFWLYNDEIEKLYNFQEKYNLIVWLTFTNNLDIPIFFYVSIIKIYEYSKFIIEGIIKRNISIHKDKYNSCRIYIPDIFLYNSISYKRGFYNETDFNFNETDVEWHEFYLLN